MKPDDDESIEMEAPMTRALFDTDLAQSAGGSVFDPEGTEGEETNRSPSRTDVEDSKSASMGSSQGAGSAWTTGGGIRRGIVGKIEPGQVLYSKYRVLKKIGSGAMGEVWLVRHVTLKSEHALKVIIPNFASNPVALMRFQRELEIMATLRQEHAVTIFDAFLDEEGGYIDMEFLDGQTIHEVLQAVRAQPDRDPTESLMPLDWIVRILDQLCEVLQVAHSKGIVHRDLKPSNIMLLNGRKPGKESLKVLDFGIAKIRDDPDSAAARDEDSESNKTQGFIGTPSYASPEQAMVRDDVDGRADLYSVGIMLYEFVTGRLPFRGNQWQVISQNANVQPPSFFEANPKLRPMPELEHAILRVLSKDRDHRPSTASQLFEEIREAVVAVMPAGSSGLTPPTWDAAPFYTPPSGTGISHPTLFPTERESQFGKQPVSTQAVTVMSEQSVVAPAKEWSDSPSNLGLVVADQPTKRGPKIAVIVGLVFVSVVVVAGLMAFMNRRPVESSANGSSGSGALGSKNTSTVEPKGGTGTATTPKSGAPTLTFESYWPPNYVPAGDASSDQIYPERVRRTTDQVYFNRIEDGIYLPDGYEIDKQAGLADDGWPKAITRDNVRFLRIVGEKAEWMMGNWDDLTGAGGSDGPAHPVILTGFYMQETEVTNGQFEAYLKSTPDKSRPEDWESVFSKLRREEKELAGRHPAVNLSHEEARLYAVHMKAQLPTEAQWEFAARSRGKEIRFVWGNAPDPSQKQANVEYQGGRTTAPVGSFPPDRTAQGLLDMTGNVQEMCRDKWEPYKQTDIRERDPCLLPSPAEARGDTVNYAIRGGDYSSIPAICGTTYRAVSHPLNFREVNLGFRLVVECPDTRKPR
jgi:eukaryotic-like serine/threonine-protein kinase